MRANKAIRAVAIAQRRRCARSCDPVGHRGAAGFFSPPIHSHAQVSRVSYIQRRAICYLGDESLALRISAVLAGTERMVPVAMRKGFMDGENVRADALSGGRIER
jgi:hypothetical protein